MNDYIKKLIELKVIIPGKTKIENGFVIFERINEQDLSQIPEEELGFATTGMGRAIFKVGENNEIIKKYASKKCSVDILEPLANIDDKKVQLILKEINNTILMYALAGASGKVCAIFMKNLSGRMLRFLDEQLQTEVFEEESIRAAQIHILQVASTLK